MTVSRKEIEIKLRYDTVDEARRAIDALGATLVEDRVFEDNVLWDTPEATLRASQQMLRLRQRGPRTILTHKSNPSRDTVHKVWEEHETVVEDFDEMRRILELLGYRPSWRYQKYRSRLKLDGLEFCLDETPLGCFVELEGAAEAIDAAAARMGKTVDDYIALSYRELFDEARERGEIGAENLMVEDHPADS
ncbi:hypothetical protein ABI59_13030 [Acidobacteria bacterium Mor1]|nr:hypothetical protein ABI59_13030 [Acidobacteria bacterium Mor1]